MPSEVLVKLADGHAPVADVTLHHKCIPALNCEVAFIVSLQCTNFLCQLLRGTMTDIGFTFPVRLGLVETVHLT